MPVFSYFAVIGSMLLGLIFAADLIWGAKPRPEQTASAQPAAPPAIKLTTTVFTHDLRREFPLVNPVTPPETTAVASAAAPSPTTAETSNPQPATKTAEVKKSVAKKKQAKVATRPKWEQYAHSYQYDNWRPQNYGSYGGYGGYGGYN